MSLNPEIASSPESQKEQGAIDALKQKILEIGKNAADAYATDPNVLEFGEPTSQSIESAEIEAMNIAAYDIIHELISTVPNIDIDSIAIEASASLVAEIMAKEKGPEQPTANALAFK